jgi:hypothetical protein
MESGARSSRRTVALAGLAAVLLAASLAGAAERPGDGASAGQVTPPGAAPGQTEANVDLAELEARLRSTDAIGFLTKLSLKGQIDDLLDAFAAYHAERQDGLVPGAADDPLAGLRERFNLLLMKVLSLVQDQDEELFRMIATSREALWRTLTDPRRFQAATEPASPGRFATTAGPRRPGGLR